MAYTTLINFSTDDYSLNEGYLDEVYINRPVAYPRFVSNKSSSITKYLLGFTLQDRVIFRLRLFLDSEILTAAAVTLYFANDYDFKVFARHTVRFNSFVQGWNNIYFDTNNFISTTGFSFEKNISVIRVFVWNSTSNPQAFYLENLCYGSFGIATCLIDFDDAHKSIDVGLEYMIENGMSPTVYTPTGRVGSSGYLSVSQIIDYSKYGVDFANHTVNHTDLTMASDNMIYSEILGAKDWLCSYGLDSGSTKLALPYGRFNDNVISICKSIGLDSVRSTIPNFIDQQYRDDLMLSSFAFGSTTNFSNIQRVLETASIGGLTISILLHRLSDVPESTLDFQLSEFCKLIDYLKYSSFNVQSISSYINCFDVQ